MLDQLSSSVNSTAPLLLQHLYGVVNGVFFTSVLLMLLTALSYGHSKHSKSITKSFLLLAIGYALFGLYNLFFQGYSGAVSSAVIPASLLLISKFSAPLALIVTTYIFLEVTSTKSYEAYTAKQQHKYFIASLYLLDLCCFIALFYIQDIRQASLLITLCFIPHSIGAVIYCLKALRQVAYGKFMSMLFMVCSIFSILFSYLMFTGTASLSSSTFVFIHLCFAVMNVIFCFISIRYGYDAAQRFFEIKQMDSRNLSQSIHKAISNNEFYLSFQPQVDLSSNTLCSLEALIRWKHPEYGLIPPNEFIPLAEEAGSIDNICQWVIKAAVRQSHIMLDQGYDLNISINFSAKNLKPEIVDYLALELAAESVPASSITVEITETFFVHETNEATLALQMLEKLGVALSLDDYGTGFSSLSYINKLSLTELKIDRSFVSDIDKNNDNYVIANSTIRMSKSLGLKVVAEGIETESVMIMLKTMGCHIAQGYYIAEAMAVDELSFWLISTHYRIKKQAEHQPALHTLSLSG